jgi:hypothetical protein
VAAQAASLPSLVPGTHISHIVIQGPGPPPQDGAAQSASLRMLEPVTHPPCATTLDLDAQTDGTSVLIDLPPMSPPEVSLKAEEACGRLPRPPEARPCCDAQAPSLPSSSHLPPSHVDTQDNGPTPQDAVAAQEASLPSLVPKTPSRCRVAVTDPGESNCAIEVDPGCLHSRSCANELGPDGLRARSGGCDDVPDIMRPSYATVVATGYARCCANGIVPDSGSSAIEPAVTAHADISPGVPICPCCFLEDGSKVTFFELDSSNPYYCPECDISWTPRQAARFTDRDDFAEACRAIIGESCEEFLSGIEGTAPDTGNHVPPNSAKGGHCRCQRRSRRR